MSNPKLHDKLKFARGLSILTFAGLPAEKRDTNVRIGPWPRTRRHVLIGGWRGRRRAAMNALPCLLPSSLIMMLEPSTTMAAGRRKHEESHHRALSLPRLVEGRGHHPPVRQSRHHRIADHACAEGSS